MSTPFVTKLRSKRPAIEFGTGGDRLSFRVQAADMWDAVPVSAPADVRVAEVKRRALSVFYPEDRPEDFVLKLRGWEMLNEDEPIGQAGIVPGSIILLAHRRRRPVR